MAESYDPAPHEHETAHLLSPEDYAQMEATSSRHPASPDAKAEAAKIVVDTDYGLGPNGYPMRLIGGQLYEARPDYDEGSSSERHLHDVSNTPSKTVDQHASSRPRQPFELPGRRNGRTNQPILTYAEKFAGMSDKDIADAHESAQYGREFADHVIATRHDLESTFGEGVVSEEDIAVAAEYTWHNPLDPSE